MLPFKTTWSASQLRIYEIIESQWSVSDTDRIEECSFRQTHLKADKMDKTQSVILVNFPFFVREKKKKKKKKKRFIFSYCTVLVHGHFSCLKKKKKTVYIQLLYGIGARTFFVCVCFFFFF